MSKLDHPEPAAQRDKLLALQSELERLLEHGKAATETVQLDQSRVGRLSRMDALQQQAMARAGQEQLTSRLLVVKRALVALQTGDYGFCEECGGSIDSARLQARPESLYCLRCQNALEQGS